MSSRGLITMKYCSHCGAEIMEEAVICPKCGCAVAGGVLDQKKAEVKKEEHKHVKSAESLKDHPWEIVSLSAFGFLFLSIFIGSLVGYYANMFAMLWIFAICQLIAAVVYLLGAIFVKDTKFRMIKIIAGASAVVLMFVVFICLVVIASRF